MMRSRYQVHAEIRRVFTRRWIDLDRIQFGEFRGLVRVSGELHTTQPTGWDPSIAIVDLLRSEILRIPEVRHVQFDLTNWSRDADGGWAEASPTAARRPAMAARPVETEDEEDEDTGGAA